MKIRIMNTLPTVYHDSDTKRPFFVSLSLKNVFNTNPPFFTSIVCVFKSIAFLNFKIDGCIVHNRNIVFLFMIDSYSR